MKAGPLSPQVEIEASAWDVPERLKTGSIAQQAIELECGKAQLHDAEAPKWT